jgi:hypothetical protein
LQESKVQQVPNESRRIIKGRVRGLGIGLHPNFNRPARDVLSSSKGSWQIEDFARALECFLPLLFRPHRSGNTSEEVLQPDIVKKSFGHLRRFGLFHMTHHSFDSEDQMLLAALEAHEELLAYCKAAEGVSFLCHAALVGSSIACEAFRFGAVATIVSHARMQPTIVCIGMLIFFSWHACLS